MDYLFVPGNDPESQLGRKVISRRPNTTLITRPVAQNHIAGLLARLAPASVTHPIGDILLVGHARSRGEWLVPLSPSVGSPCDFEKTSDADAADTIRLQPALLQATTSDPLQTITVRLIGCNMGKYQPLV